MEDACLNSFSRAHSSVSGLSLTYRQINDQYALKYFY